MYILKRLSCFLNLRPTLDATDPQKVQVAIEESAKVRAELKLLTEEIDGTVVVASDQPDYDAARRITWSFHDAGYPIAIVKPANVNDLQIIVKQLAALHEKKGVQVAVKGGGHTSMSVVDNAVVIDLENINGIHTDLDNKLVIVGGGCRIADVDAKLTGTGYGFVTGTNGHTGVAGLTLSAGVGFLSRLHGFAADNCVEYELVTAKGEVLLVNDKENTDLFRGLKGGGGNFGIVTKFTLKLHDVRDAFGGLSVRLAPTVYSAATSFKNWRDATIDLPDDTLAIAAFPCGAPVCVFGGAQFGEMAKEAKSFADTNLAFTKDLGGWVELSNSMKKVDYHTELQTLLLPFNPPKQSISCVLALGELTDDIIDSLVNLIRVDYASTEGVIIIFVCGGAMARSDHSNNLISSRKAKYWVIYEGNNSIYDTAEDVEASKDWMGKVRELLIDSHGGMDGPYPMQHNAKKPSDHKAYDGDHKLAGIAIKKKWDPNNLFCLNKNISPDS